MKIAVTAVSGQLGHAIASNLVASVGGENVVGLARTPGHVKGLDIDLRPGDYDSPDQLHASLAGIDAVLLVSGMEAPDKRIRQHRNVIEAAHANGVRKIVYTSIQGPEEGTAFSPVVQSNRQTEADIRASGMNWAIGRNGIYIEPDVEYIDSYKTVGEVANCAGDAKCGYTTRAELAQAYASLLTRPELDGGTYNLHGTAITQSQLVDYLNKSFDARLTYHEISVADFAAQRSAELGDFLGQIIGGIYEGIRLGAFDNPSDYQAVTGRAHQSWDDYFGSL